MSSIRLESQDEAAILLLDKRSLKIRFQISTSTIKFEPFLNQHRIISSEIFINEEKRFLIFFGLSCNLKHKFLRMILDEDDQNENNNEFNQLEGRGSLTVICGLIIESFQFR